jgi:LuxR family maltose regulon positive regulatory protein
MSGNRYEEQLFDSREESAMTPIVQGETLVFVQDGQKQALTVGSAAWFAWLEMASTFSYVGETGSFTARRELSGHKRGGWYWKAYRKQHGQLFSRYLGKSETLTLARLQTVAQALADAPVEASSVNEADEARPSAQATVQRMRSDSLPSLLSTKLHRPLLRAQLVLRPRLLERLAQGIAGPLTIIAAPAGFGKTTLLSSWLEHASLRSTWLSLEQDDDELTRFWSYVFAAFSRVYPGSEASALALLQGTAPQPDPQELPPIETVLTALINGLAALSDEVALILDDYHVITEPSIHRSLTYLVEHLPPRLHLVISTRADPPLPLARLRTRGHLTEIRSVDLRFTSEETSSFLVSTLGLHLSGDDIAALEARTEGWIAGLQLAGLSMRGRRDIPAFLQAFTGSQRYIIDYLTEEVLARQSPFVQTFLLQTSILERLSGSLCEAVLGKDDREASGQAMLELLEQANLFLVPLDDERRWYRYHQLFAEALRHLLQRAHPALLPELHRRASAWYEKLGLTHDAVSHALAATDFLLAARLIEHAFLTFSRLGEFATLQRWITALPDELVRSSIKLSILRGWLLFTSGKHDEALLHLEDIERTFGLDSGLDEPGEPRIMPTGMESQAEIKGLIATIRASIAFSRGDLPRTIELSGLALEYLPKENISRAYAAWYLGRAYWLREEVSAASLALAEAAHISWEVDHLYGVFLVTHDLARIQKLQGQLHQVDQTYRQALELALERGGDLPATGPAYVGRGQLEYEWNHLEEATSLLQEGITRCERSGNGRVILQAQMTLAFIKQARGDPDGARAIMQQVVQTASRRHLSQYRNAQVEACSAWLSLMQGDEAAVLRWQERCDLTLDGQVSHVHEREYLTLVRVLLTQRRFDEAGQWLARLLQLAEAQGRTGSVVEILMLQALGLHASSEVHQAIERLERSLALAEPEGYIRLFVDEGAPMAHLLGQMRRAPGDQPGSTRYPEHLLAELHKAENASDSPVAVPGSGMDLLVEPLSEREQEVLRLIVAGCSNREIAERLVIAVSTVKWYVNAIYGKLQVESRTKAIARARELNIV